MSTETLVDSFPPCDLNPAHGPAAYDARVQGLSSWAYQCEECFAALGAGLGLGLGQRLVLREVPPTPRLRGATVADQLAQASRLPSRRQ